MDLVDLERVRVARSRDDLVLGPGEAYLAGGTWLYSERQRGVTGLVDLTGLGWPPLTVTAGGLSIAATCTFTQLAALAPQPGWAAQPLLGVAVDALLGSWKVHRWATVGGNLCLALPAGPMVALCAGLDGTAVVWTPEGGERRLPVVDLVTGVRRTSLAPGEVLRAVELPTHALASRVAHRRIALADLGRSAAFVVARRAGTGLVLTVTGATPRPVQVRFGPTPTSDEVAAAVDEACEWYDDPHGSPRWRRAMTLRFAEELRVALADEVSV